MRATLIGLTVLGLALGLSACGKKDAAGDGQVAATEPSSAPAAAPAPIAPTQRKAGLWKQTMTADGHSMVSRFCTDAAFEKTASLMGSSMAGACSQSMTPTAGGWKMSSTCDMGTGGKTTTEGTVTGDFTTKVEVKATSTTSGAAAPQMNRTSQMDCWPNTRAPARPAGSAAILRFRASARSAPPRRWPRPPRPRHRNSRPGLARGRRSRLQWPRRWGDQNRYALDQDRRRGGRGRRRLGRLQQG